MTDRRPRRRRAQLLRLVGAAVVAVSLGLCVAFAVRHASRLPPETWSWGAAAALLAAAGLYLVSYVLVAIGWHQLLQAVDTSGRPPTLRPVVAAYLGAQIGKYLPGNVMQYAGRVELLRRLGVERPATAATLLLEIVTQIMTAVAVAALAVLVSGEELMRTVFAGLPYRRLLAAVLVLAAVLAAGAWVLRRRGALDPLLAARRGVGAAGVLLGCGVLYTLFFILNGLGLGLLGGVISAASVPWGLVIGLFAAAWVAGFVTPGAPAGLGVRDLLLLTVLGTLWDPGTALAVTVAYRLATTLADAGAFLVALVERRFLAPKP